MNRPPLFAALRITGIYTLLGVMWIIASDRLLELTVPDLHALTVIQTYKGWAFVLASGLLIFLVLHRELRARVASENTSESMLRSILSTSPVGILGLTPDRSIAWVNEACLEMFGFESEEEVVGRSTAIVYPSDAEYDRVGKMLYEGLKTGQTTSVDAMLKRKDGSLFDGLIRMKALGEPDLAIAAISDISERRRAEELLKESEARTRTKLDSILLPEGDIGTLELEDVVDVPAFQALMVDFFSLSKLPVGLIDLKGKVLVATGWQEICTKFHRAHPETCQYCIESDTVLSGRAEPGSFKLYRCKNNLWDVATPIIVGGKHLGNLFLGQFLFEDEKIDYDAFRSQASHYGFDEHEYLSALEKVPRWTRETVDLAMAFYTKLANMLSALSYSNIKLARSVAEQKLLLNTLRESEQRYRAVVDNIEIGISVLNPDMQVVEINKVFKRYFPHVRPGSGQICYEQYNDPPRSGPCTYCPSVLTLRDGKVHEAITETPAGSEIRHYHLVSSPIKDPQGRIQYVIELTEDITERKRAEEMLRQAERKYRRLFEDAPLMYVITRNEDGVPFISDCNGQFLKSLGYSQEEVMGQPLANFYSSTSSAALLEGGGYARALAGEFFIGERQLLRSDGRLVPTLLYTAPEVGPSGEVIGTCAMFVDVTEQKKAEEALIRSEAQLSSAVTMAHLGHWEYEVATNLFTFNDHFYKIFGSTAEQVGGYTMSPAGYTRRFVHPEDRHIVGDEIKKSLETANSGLSRQLEHRIIYANGETGYISVQIFLVKDDLGRTVSAYGVNQDITQRVQMEALVRESEQRYRTLVEESFDGLFVYKGPKILFANRRLYEMLGYAQGELEGMDHALLCHPDYRQVVDERVAARLQGEEVTPHYEILLQRKDGSTLEVEIRAKLLNIMGESTIQAWIRDVSERKRSEESQRRLATAVEQAAEAVVVTDTSGRIQYVNPAFGRITGYTPKEVMGQNTALLKSGEHDEQFYRNLWATITRGEVWKGRIVNKKKDGGLYHEEMTISPVRDSGGKITNFVAVKRDITEHLELARQLLQAQKMEAIGTLAGGIAHDFNNLLQVTLGYSELLLSEKKETDLEYADLSKIFHAAKSGAELVQRLLTFSRKVESKPIALSLNRQIVRVESLLRRTIPKMIDIQMDLSGDLAEIHADPTQMEQVLMNLAVNARDAMPDKGTLTVRTKNITLDEAYCSSHAEARPGKYVLLTVSDTGHGMDEATTEHIFEPFYTTKELGRGTGQGLATVYGIVKQHGGYITCDSEVGQGTTFEVYFPAIETQVEPDVEKTGEMEMPPFGTETILLVDDEDFVRDLGERILNRAGYKVLTAANGKEALDVFGKKRTEISLVILDLIMPEMGGKECLQALKTIDPQLKVIVASGLTTDPSTKESLETDARAFVSKPFRVKEMLTQVRKVLDEG